MNISKIVMSIVLVMQKKYETILFACVNPILAEDRSISVEKRRIERPSHIRKLDSDFAEHERRGRLLGPRLSKNFRDAFFERHFYRILMDGDFSFRLPRFSVYTYAKYHKGAKRVLLKYARYLETIR